MANVNNESQNFVQTDEIDLIDLIVSIWQGKWIIIASTVFATIIGVGYYLMSPAPFQANVELKALTQQEATWLDEVSTLSGVGLNVDNAISFYTNNIKNEQFIEQFIDSYFANQLEKFELEKPSEAANIEYEFDVLNANINSEFRSIIGTKLTFSSFKLSPSELKDFSKAFLAHLEKAQKNDIIGYIKQKSGQYEDNIHTQMATINLQKQIIASQYQEQLEIDIEQIEEKIIEVTAKTKAYLKTRTQTLRNNIKIAKKLNIERPGQTKSEMLEGSAIINTIETGSMPLFMQGYVALEEELASIENNTNLDYFSKELRDLKIRKNILANRDKEVILDPEIVKLNGQLLRLKNDIARANYSSFLNEGNLALFSPQIMKTTSSLSGTDFITKTSPRKLIIILAIFAGGFIGIVLVFMLSIIRAVQKKLKLEKS